MSEDRFGDLGRERDRPAEENGGGPAPGQTRPPKAPRSANKYAWAVGILFVMILSVLLFVQTLPNSGESLFGPERGTQLKDFAAPSAVGNLTGDVNLCQRQPCPEGSGRVPACDVLTRDVVNLCGTAYTPDFGCG